MITFSEKKENRRQTEKEEKKKRELNTTRPGQRTGWLVVHDRFVYYENISLHRLNTTKKNSKLLVSFLSEDNVYLDIARITPKIMWDTVETAKPTSVS